MSLQTGITGLEKAAENRGMRPQGRDMRPAKLQPAVNQRKTFDDDSEENFIRPPVHRQNQRGNINVAPPSQNRDPYPRRRSPDRDSRYDRYDRYDAPSGQDNRSRGDWYNTDSFGQRRRSRSPDQGYNGRHDVDSYRPYDQTPPSRRSATTLPPTGRFAGYSDRYERGPSAQARNWQPPPPPGPPPGSGSSYRPGAGLLARPQQGDQRNPERGGYR